ncbi:MAG TPA: histone deacetylase [Polyangiaceae bacterium]|nr:histone deacetylase [Polyangiaceae bacterium]
MNRVLLVDDALFLEHAAPPEHPERAERLLAVRQGLSRAASSGSVSWVGGAESLTRPASNASGEEAYIRLRAKDATEEQLGRVHDPSYLGMLGHLAGRSGYLDADTFLSPSSIAAARRAAGSAVSLVDALAGGSARFGLAVPRPPGHHALPDRAMGFCLLNNVAVAAAHARTLGHQRVLVLDWDVHHGNGTEAMFYADPAVLFVSLHQFPNYPGTGDIADHGQAEGRGATVNLPLPRGGTDSVYEAAFRRIVLPIVEQFAPTLALVSCGFDAHARDPLADMQLSAQGYAAMTRSLIDTLDERCPLGIVLEGGYDLEALRESSQAVATVLFGGDVVKPAEAQLAPEQQATLERIARAQSSYWKLD